MGGANSRSASEDSRSVSEENKHGGSATPEEILIQMVDNAIEIMEANASAASASANDMLKLAMSSLKEFDNCVTEFVRQCPAVVTENNLQILDAYYDATQKAQNAALEVQRHARVSARELNRLRAVSRNYEKEPELAIKELARLNTENMNLPIATLLEILKEASDAYQNVIRVCEKKLTGLKKMRGILQVVAVGCVVALVMAICALAQQLQTTSDHSFTVQLGINTAMWVGRTAASIFTSRIEKLNELAQKIVEQQELVKVAQKNAEELILTIKTVQDTVQRMHSKLSEIVDATTTAVDWQGRVMEDITCPDFLHRLDSQLKELTLLSETCDELYSMVDQAMSFFKKKSGLITERVLHGKSP